jgi:TonB-linked SusC/RagA family outer membrane protein
LNIRGQGSLSSSSPYILIDGIRATQSEFANLNPNDIENISILKDAASASIYGAHAAFGVILVETKKGNRNKFSINYSNSVRIKKRIFVPDFVNSVEYAKVANEAGRNFNGQETFSQEQIQMMQDFIDGKLGKYGTAENPNNPNQWLGIGDGSSNGWLNGYANTDWWELMYKNVDVTQKHDLSFRGGGEKWTYYVSGGILSDPGQLRYGDKSEYFSRQNLNSNISVNVTKWLKLTNIGRVTKTRNSFPATLEGASRGRLYHDIMRFSPNIPWRTPPVVDNDGTIIVPEQLDFLPGFNENNGFDKYTNFEFLSSFRAEIKITKDLVLNGDYSFKRNTHEETLNYKRWDLLGPDGAPSITYQKNNNQIKKDWSIQNYESFNIYANYKKSLLNGHNLDLLLGYQQEESNSEGLTAGRMVVVGSDLNSINTAVGEIIQPNNPIESFATVGAFGRFSYNYQQKYLMEFQGRYDGSSKFAPGHRFGIFPSVSLGYNLDRENYWKALEKVVNRLKIRASWGKLGNQEVTGYLFQPAISISTQLPWVIDGERPVYVNPPNIVSPNITWETSSTLNFGIDASFVKNRLSGTFDIYTRKVDNMFGPIAALPATLGVAPPETNSASLKTKGWEFTLGWRDQEGSISYNARLMLSRNRTIVTRYNNPEKVIGFRYEGEVLGEIWGYEANSLFQSEEEVTKYLSAVDLNFLGTNWQPGDVKYIDLNEDGKVNNGNNTISDPGDRRIIGNSNPQFQISFLAGISWRNFDLDMLLQGVGKTGVFMDDYATLLWGWNSQPHTHLTQKAIDNMWTKENPGGYLPIQLSSGGRSGFTKDRFPSTRYLLNGSYLRLKSLDIGYTLKAPLAKRLRLNKLRVFVAGENLVTFTKMWSTFDPELAVTGTKGRTSDGRAYPLARVFSFGLDVSF